ncbi:MAG: hypothetical protein KGH87_08915 [Thaumarchaeota archaeon]|nr:hypothetical protein [Nitrososphaerota archaeon]MDE1840025.1 hypothetical protein [Nitrososphaerota archaeon]
MKKCRTCKQLLDENSFDQIYLKQYDKIVICGNICKDCKNKRRKTENNRNKGYLNKIKIKLINEMGGKCVCCGLTQWWILTLDHIIPIKGKNREHSYKLYYKLLKDLELRKDFQIMCYGCNSSKNDGEKCTLNHYISV